MFPPSPSRLRKVAVALPALLLALSAAAQQPPGRRRTQPVPRPASPATKPAGGRVPAGGDTLAAADAAYGAKLFAQALAGYRAAQQADKVPAARKALVEYRIARCYGLTRQWGPGLSEPLAVAERRAGTIWDARCRAWLMELYLAVPHQAYRSSEGLTRVAAAAAAPPGSQVVDLRADDAARSVAYGEQALAVYRKLRPGLPDASEESDHAATLAEVVSRWSLEAFLRAGRRPAADSLWELEPAAEYDPAWPFPRKVQQLFFYAENTATPVQRPLARLGRALWVRRYQEAIRRAGGRPGSFPYQDLSAVALLRAFIRDFPSHPEVDHSRCLVGEWLAADGLTQEAGGVLRVLAADRPGSPWGRYAAALLTGLTGKLTLSAPGIQRPAARGQLRVQGGNGQTLRFRVRPLKLVDLLLDRRFDGRSEGIRELLSLVPAQPDLARFLTDEEMAWESTPRPDGSVETPVLRTGAYLVTAEEGAAAASTVLVMSDLAVAQFQTPGQVVVFCTNADSGQPVSRADVALRVRTGKSVRTFRQASDAEGTSGRALGGAGGAPQEVSVLAWKGDRIAFSSILAAPATKSPAGLACGLELDRGVVGSGELLQARGLVTRDEGGIQLAQPGVPLLVSLLDGAGDKKAGFRVETGGHGEFRGVLRVPTGARPGEYRVSVQSTTPAAELRVAAVTVTGAGLEPLVVQTTQARGEKPGDPGRVRLRVRSTRGLPAGRARAAWKLVRADGSGWGAVIAAGSLTLDAAGRGELTAPRSEQATHLSLDVVDSEGRRASRIVRWGSAEGDGLASIELAKRFVSVGDAIVGRVTGWKAPAAELRLSLRRASETLPVQTLALRMAGESVAFQLPTGRPGRYLLELRSADGSDMAETECWVAGPGVESDVPPAGLVLVPENDAVLGRPLRVLAVSGVPDLTLLMAELGEDRLLDTRLTRLSGHSQVLTIEAAQRHLPRLRLWATGRKDGRYLQAQSTVPVRESIEPQVQPLIALKETPEGRAVEVRVPNADGRKYLVWVAEASASSDGSRAQTEGSPLLHAGGVEWPAASASSGPGPVRPAWSFPEGYGGLDAVRPLLPRGEPVGPVVPHSTPPPSRRSAAPPKPGLTRIVLPAGGDGPWLATVDASDGRAVVPLSTIRPSHPETLTVRICLPDGTVFEQDLGLPTRSQLELALDAPRAVRERDVFLVGARLENPSDQDRTVSVSLSIAGRSVAVRGSASGETPGPRPIEVPRPDGLPGVARPRPAPPAAAARQVTVPALSEATVHWELQALSPGSTELRFESPALAAPVRTTLAVEPHARPIRRTTALLLDSDQLSLSPQTPVPQHVEVRYYPSFRAALLDAGRDEAQMPECTDRLLLACQMAAIRRAFDPALDADLRAAANRATETAIRRFLAAQNRDGGWGLFEGSSSDGRLTALSLIVLRSLAGLQGFDGRPLQSSMGRAAAFLQLRMAEETGPHTLGLICWALSGHPGMAASAGRLGLEKVYPQLSSLSASGIASLALTFRAAGLAAEAEACRKRLFSLARTAGKGSRCSWYAPTTGANWYREAVYTQALAIRVLTTEGADHPLWSPSIRSLLALRRGSHWGSPRAGVAALLALLSVARVPVPDVAPLTVEHEGTTLASLRPLPAATGIATVPGRLVSSPLSFKGAAHPHASVVVVSEYFPPEEPQAAQAGECSIERRYYLWRRPAEGAAVRREVLPGDALAHGDDLEVVLDVTCSRALEGLVLVDPLPASAELRSGGSGTYASSAHALHWRVALALAGKSRFSYRIRLVREGIAHVPGTVADCVMGTVRSSRGAEDVLFTRGVPAAEQATARRADRHRTISSTIGTAAHAGILFDTDRGVGRRRPPPGGKE